MARADTYTKLSLNRWATIMGVHPLHFCGVIMPDLPPTVCAKTWNQYPWQDTDTFAL